MHIEQKRNIKQGRFGAVALWIATLTAALAPTASGQGIKFEDAQYKTLSGLLMGTSVAVRGRTLVAGSPGDEGHTYAGAAMVFDVITGELRFILQAFDGMDQDHFGAAVAIGDDYIVVGAPDNDELGQDAGGAYVFSPDTGEFLFKITAQDSVAGQRFGASVAVSGTTALVGSPYAVHGNGYPGAAYLFDLTLGLQSGKLTAPNGQTGDEFGWSVALDDATAVVGAPKLGPPFQSGAAFVFDLATQQQRFRFTAFDGAVEDSLGWSVAVGGSIGVAGAPGAGGGAAYVFNTTTGQFIDKTTSPNPSPDGSYGHSVAIGTGAVLVGAPFEPGPGGQGGRVGAAYLYDRATGDLVNELRHSEAEGRSEYLGYAVATDDGIMLAGASAFGTPLFIGAVFGYNFGPRPQGVTGSRVVDAGSGPVVLTVQAGQTDSYLWRLDGVELQDGPLFSGTTTPTLTVTPEVAAEGEYDVLLRNQYGEVASPIVVLGIRQGCLADADNNGIVDTRDVLAFLHAWLAGCP